MSAGTTLKKAKKSEFSGPSNFTMVVREHVISEAEYVGLLLLWGRGCNALQLP